MAVNTQSAYAGEVMDKLLIKATTGNELVRRSLIHIEPNVNDKFYIPRFRGDKMLCKRIEQPVDADSKGNFFYDERKLEPVEFMAFTTFNPRSFEKIWKKWQPSGELVFRELPKEAQNAMLGAMASSVEFELGHHFIQGKAGDDDDHLFNGVLTRIIEDKDVIKIKADGLDTMVNKLKAVHARIPVTIRTQPGLRLLMSIEDADIYDNELIALTAKGANWTDSNAMRFKGITIEAMASWPKDVIVATVTGMDIPTNLWAAVNHVNDFEAIKIDRLTNSGERFFFKMLMKADTNIAFGDEVVLLDSRVVTENEL